MGYQIELCESAQLDIAILQKSTTLQKSNKKSLKAKSKRFGVGVYVIPVPSSNESRLDENDSQRLIDFPLGSKFIFSNPEERFRQVNLEKGAYVLIPCTFKPD